MTKCWSCSADLGALDFGRQDACQRCGRGTRVCKNCEHYDPRSHNECRETVADRVVDKEKGNFCDYFKPGGGPGGVGSSRDAMKAAADALFKKK